VDTITPPKAEVPQVSNPESLKAEQDIADARLGATESDGTFTDLGHLVERHVGKTEQELIDRAKGVNPPKGGASSFTSLNSASHYTSQVLDARSADINSYLNSGETRTKEFDLDTGKITGQWVPNGGIKSQPVTGVRVVIKPNPNSPKGYDIVTGYPVDPSNFTNP
jgi:hypothetical protein